MQITYRIEQYDIDDFKIIITKPEYLSGIRTKIHTPHLLLSELQQNIAKNLTQNIHSFCVKHKQYADVLRKESFEFTPDERDKHSINDNSCWFYTGKFIDDTDPHISADDKDAISYENLIRYDGSYSATPDTCYQIIADPRWMKHPTGVIKLKSLQPHTAIDASRIHAAFGIELTEIYKWVEHQKEFAPNKGNTYNQTVFPRHNKKENGQVRFPISELQRYLNKLYGRGYKDLPKKNKYKKKYDTIKANIIDYSKNHTPREILEKYGFIN